MEQNPKLLLQQMLEAHWPQTSFPALHAEAREAWNSQGLGMLWTSILFTVPAMSDLALPGGQLPDSRPQVIAITPTEESLAPVGDSRRASLAFGAVSQLLMATSAGDPATQQILRRVNSEWKGTAVYMVIVAGLSTLAAIDGEMPGAGAVTLRNKLADIDVR